MITLGAVATGSMNAQLALIAAGTMNSFGSIAAPTAAAASTGISRVVVAVLLVVSVRKVTARQIAAISSSGCQADSALRLAPSAVLRPVAAKAPAMAMPEPNSSSMPQGILAAVSQASSRPPRPSGIRNIATTATSATM